MHAIHFTNAQGHYLQSVHIKVTAQQCPYMHLNINLSIYLQLTDSGKSVFFDISIYLFSFTS